jgi:release factor glutamine methyltransferase
VGRRLGRLAVRARYLLKRRRYGRLVLEDVDGLPILVLPQVFNPKLLRSGEFLVRELHRRPRLFASARRVLDLGTGSGVGAVAAARAGCAVVAVDINPAAVRCTRINVLLNDVEARVSIQQGDLFAPVIGDRFDLVLFNPPYYRGTPRSALDHAWRATDVIERFAAGLGQHLTPGGQALMVLSSDGEPAAFLEALTDQGFTPRVLADHEFLNERMWLYAVSEVGAEL